jgi:hypothetical protein
MVNVASYSLETSGRADFFFICEGKKDNVEKRPIPSIVPSIDLLTHINKVGSETNPCLPIDFQS